MSNWQLMNFTEAQLFPRGNPVVSMLNSTQILVMGGFGIVDDEESNLADVYFFDMQTEQLDKRVQNFPGLLQFHSVGNRSAQFKSDNVVALVENDEQSKTMVV